MALNTLTMLKAATRSILGEPIPRDGGFTEQEIILQLNLSQLDVCRRLLRINQEEFYSIQSTGTSNGVYDYDLNSDVLEIMSVTLGDKYMKKVSPEDIGVLYSNDNFTPSQYNYYWFRFGNKIRIFPTPGTVLLGQTPGLKIYYIQKPTEMEDPTDTTIVPDQYLDLMVHYASMKLANRTKHLKQGEMEQQYSEFWKRLIEDFVGDKQLKESIPGTGDVK